jgi:Kef-type K+ transport system membrane component KefB
MYDYLIQLIVVLVVARLLTWLLGWLGQPAVVAEMTAGFVLGPVALGAISPATVGWLMSAKGALDALGLLGLTLFMFVVGAELRMPGGSGVRSRSAPVLIAITSIAVPAALALAIAPWAYQYAPVGVAFWPFACFLCLALATTAVPVMARLLQERGGLGSTEGAVSLSAAAFSDVAVWISLPLIIGWSKAEGDVVGSLRSCGALIVLAAAAHYTARPLLAAWWRRVPGDASTAVIVGPPLLCAVIFAAITSAIGFHAVFGAFLAGVCLPRDLSLQHKLETAVTPVSALVLLPCFFASAGFATLPISTIGLGTLFAGLLLVAVAGKLAGGAAGMRLAGYDWNMSARVGVLMNIRGMMELVVITIGFQAGVIGANLFTALFLMAIVTTAMAAPILAALSVRRTKEIA